MMVINVRSSPELAKNIMAMVPKRITVCLPDGVVKKLYLV